MAFLKLIRFQNLLIIALVQLLVKYSLFPAMDAAMEMTDLQFGLLVLATICIAAAGNVINDIYDVEIDEVNKPTKVIVGKKISEKAAYRWFIVLNIAGVGAGFYLANTIGKPAFATLFIIISALLYMYASYLKSITLVGNLVVSLLVAMSLLIVGIFDLITPLSAFNRDSQLAIFEVLLEYAAFAFYINLMREIVKDLQDINGDKKGGLTTLPIVLGRKRTMNIVFAMGVIGIGILLYYLYSELYQWQAALLYFLFLIIAPLLYFCIQAWNTDPENNKAVKAYGKLSLLLKIIMVSGICSLLLYTFA